MEQLIEKFLKLETQVWEALRLGNPSLDAQMLSDDFLGVYPTGFSGKQEHCDQLNSGPTVASYELLNPKLVILSEEQVLLSYLAVWSRFNRNVPSATEKMFISSIWKRFEAGWKNTFSQDTPAN